MSDSPDLAAIRAKHGPDREPAWRDLQRCIACFRPWPCDAAVIHDAQAERLARLENGQPAPTGIDALLTEAKAYLGGSFPLTPVHVQMARLVDALEAQVELRTRDQADLAAAHAALAQAVEQEGLWEDEAEKALTSAAEQRGRAERLEAEVLRRTRVVGLVGDRAFCSVCLQFWDLGHKDGCRIAPALAPVEPAS